MIVGTKKLEDRRTLAQDELKGLFMNAGEMAKQGVPDGVPAAVPVGQLLELTVTVKRFNDLAVKLSELEDGMEHPELIEAIDNLREEAKVLLAAPPAPQVVAPPQGSKIIMPGS